MVGSWSYFRYMETAGDLGRAEIIFAWEFGAGRI